MEKQLSIFSTNSYKGIVETNFFDSYYIYGITPVLFDVLDFVQVKGNSIVLNLFKKNQDNWSHLTVHEKKMKDAKLVVWIYPSLLYFRRKDQSEKCAFISILYMFQRL